jgi:hypothetical protein
VDCIEVMAGSLDILKSVWGCFDRVLEIEQGAERDSERLRGARVWGEAWDAKLKWSHSCPQGEEKATRKVGLWTVCITWWPFWAKWRNEQNGLRGCFDPSVMLREVGAWDTCLCANFGYLSVIQTHLVDRFCTFRSCTFFTALITTLVAECVPSSTPGPTSIRSTLQKIPLGRSSPPCSRLAIVLVLRSNSPKMLVDNHNEQISPTTTSHLMKPPPT